MNRETIPYPIAGKYPSNDSPSLFISPLKAGTRCDPVPDAGSHQPHHREPKQQSGRPSGMADFRPVQAGKLQRPAFFRSDGIRRGSLEATLPFRFRKQGQAHCHSPQDAGYPAYRHVHRVSCCPCCRPAPGPTTDARVSSGSAGWRRLPLFRFSTVSPMLSRIGCGSSTICRISDRVRLESPA